MAAAWIMRSMASSKGDRGSILGPETERIDAGDNKAFQVGTGQPFCLEAFDLFHDRIVKPEELPRAFLPRLDGRPHRLFQKFLHPFEDGMVGARR